MIICVSWNLFKKRLGILCLVTVEKTRGERNEENNCTAYYLFNVGYDDDRLF